MHEAIGAIIDAAFPSATRFLNVREIDFWEDIFDWKNAALRLYPSWWSNRPARDPDDAPDSFVNASWARLYLPIKPGYEDVALRWIYDRVTVGRASADTERLIAKVTKELDAYRTQSFGGRDELAIGSTSGDACPPVSEKFVCLGKWEETVPTDGTHTEVMQATSSAADDYSRSLLDDADALRNEQIDRVKRENALREKAEKEGLGDITTVVDLTLGPEPPPPPQ